MPHARCGWILDTDPMGNPAGVVSFQNNASFFNAIHPFFYSIQDSTFALTATSQDPNHVIPTAARAAGTALWPAIAGPSSQAARDGFGQLLNDKNRRTEHVQALVNELRAPQLVPGNPVYAGFEIDYEGLDNRYQEGFLQFLRDLTDQAHGLDLGKQISVTVGAWTTDQANDPRYPSSPYNYTKLLEIVDFIHPQFYDFHRVISDGSGHLGPVAPLGYVADALQVVVNTGETRKFIYGMPNYGLTARVVSGDPDPTVTHATNGLHYGFGSLNQLRSQCDPSTFQTTTDHMQRPCPPPSPDMPPCCPYENTDQNFEAGRQPNCRQAADPSISQFFDDLDSLEERLKLAHDRGLGGMAYYTVGDELPGFFDMVRRYFGGANVAGAWDVTGNSGTDPSTNFLGTTDHQPLIIRTNNVEALRVGEDGHLVVKALVDGGGIILEGSAVPTPRDVGVTFQDNVDPTIRAHVGFSNAPNAWMTGTQSGDIGLFADPGRVHLGTGPDTATPQLMICNSGNSPDSFRPGLWLGDSAISFATSTNDGTGEFIRSNRPSGTPNSIGLDFYAGYTPRLSITNDGNVGIGTQEPSARLDVAGDIRVQGNVLSGHADCAEDFEADEAELIEPGTVMSMDSSARLRPSSRAYDSRVAGVVSGAGDLRPAIRLNHQAATKGNRVPIALLGRVMCKVEAESEPIEIGDLLTTSDTPGHAMKAKDPSRAFGTILGKAMAPAVGGCSLIPILVALQ